MTTILSLLQATADAAGEFAPKAVGEVFGPRALLTQATYVAASVCFMLGLKALTKPESARRGIRLAAVGMLLAVVGTLIVEEIVEYQWIAGGLLLGAAIGYPLGTRVPMTIASERMEEFSPGLDTDLMALLQAAAEMEMEEVQKFFGPVSPEGQAPAPGNDGTGLVDKVKNIVS